MNKRIKAMLCGLICLLLAAAALPAFAAEADESAAETGTVLTISTEEEFLAFAEACRLDSYSRGLTVSLESDLDLTGVPFESIPIFCGTFKGNSHTIRGLELTGEGSVQGLFRYLTETAVVKGLSVAGRITPGGLQTAVGGIAGENAGRIEACSFYGTVSGGEKVGGIAGVNTVTGIIESCRMSGTLQGRHFAGGIAGENAGVIRACLNNAGINTTAQQNSVEISDITIDTVTGTEAANTVTDIGGIAGSSTGVIRDCENKGTIGYQHMGYNIGGIAGRQTGYITGCTNNGQIFGRKEAGGIVGQMEPVARLEFTEDTLQILQGQLDTVSQTADRAAANAQSSAAALQQQLITLRDQAAGAADAAQKLLPELEMPSLSEFDPEDPSLPELDWETPSLPDEDSLLALQNSLVGSMSALSGTAAGIADSVQNTATTLSRDVQSLVQQVEGISATLDNAQENLGGSVTDVSDEDTDADTTSKVENCRNHAAVSADISAGGIVGSMAPESDLDPEADISVSGSASLNFAGELRAVVRNCENTARITTKRQNAGGIVGWQSMGLVKACRSTGELDAGTAEYVGGIVGQSSGYLRDCSANCAVSGARRVGGIAGSGAVVTDCRSMVRLEGNEKLGAILGEATEPAQQTDAPRSGNLYLPVYKDRGGIDGVSYEGIAEPRTLEEFLALEDLDEMFRYVTLHFTFADGTRQTVRMPAGSAVLPEDMPSLPEKTGFAAHWKADDNTELSNVLFDAYFEAVYTGYDAVIQSEAAGENGAPLLLVQGDFSSAATVTVSAAADVPPLEKRETALGSWVIEVSETERLVDGRLLLPAGAEAADLHLWTQDGGGWRELPFTADGSYAVFALDGSTRLLALTQTEPLPWTHIGAAGAALLGLVLIVVSTARKRKKKKTAAKTGAGQDK